MPDLSQRTITPAPPTDSTQKVVREQAISQAAAAYLAALDRANQTGPATEVTGPATGTTTE